MVSWVTHWKFRPVVTPSGASIRLTGGRLPSGGHFLRTVLVAGAGALATTTINQQIKARVADGSTVISSNAVSVSANDNGLTSSIDLDATSFSFGTLSALAAGVEQERCARVNPIGVKTPS